MKIKALEEDNNKDIVDLKKKLALKEKEINNLKLKLGFELLPEEKLMTVIFVSVDETIYYSIICKNTDKFSRLSDLFNKEYPQYEKYENYFLLNGKKVNINKTLDLNNIKNGDVIILKQTEKDY